MALISVSVAFNQTPMYATRWWMSCLFILQLLLLLTVCSRRDGQAELARDWEASYIDGLLATDNYLLISSN